ncbi:MAG: four helix bundle protein [Bacteroidales bacterium]|jgi:four helix bundle protein|nr:four helix bundle protein [Bacteroidales bacterium]
MEQEENNIIKNKSFKFALRIVKLRQYLNKEKKEYSIADQVLRSGTSIGANVSEAEYAQSRADFISKMSIALKEANETRYWLKLLVFGEYLDEKLFKSLFNDCKELISILHSIVKTSKEKK